MLEILAVLVMLVSADHDNDKLIKNAYYDLGENNKVERVEAKLSRLNKKLDRTHNRIEVNSEAHVYKVDMDRKMRKLYKKRAKYIAQLEVAKHEELKDIAVQLPLYNYDNKALKTPRK